MKTCLTVHDLSCHGASSLSVVLPLLNAAHLDVSFLPSALLSTQSDGFDNLYMKPLDEECVNITKRWKEYGLDFDCFYSGWLASDGQMEFVLRLRKEFLRPEAVILTDPVMGDDGKLYQGLESAHVAMMRQLVAGSDYITPNLTEALLLLDAGPMKTEYSRSEAEEIAMSLQRMSGADAVVTSIPLKGGVMVNAASDGSQTRFFPFEREKASYPGCGDMFASLFLSCIMHSEPFFVSVMKATRITSHAIKRTLAEGRQRREGVSVYHALKAMFSQEFVV